MAINDFIKGILTALLQKDHRDWWVQIITMKPHCTYYFGPFHSADAAKAAYPGYIDDLRSESAQVVEVAIRRCEPKHLTLCHEEVG